MYIYQLELTSECNLGCGYCPHKKMKRAHEHMPLNTVERVLDYPFIENIVCGHHFGEPLLHPDILEIADICRRKGLAFGFSTNAVVLTIESFRELVEAGLSWLKISFHAAKGRAMYSLIRQQFPDFILLTSDLKLKHDWAGLVEGEGLDKGRGKGACLFHRYNLGVISAQAEVLSCCMDAEGISSIGSVFDFTPGAFLAYKNDIRTPLCSSCPMRRNEDDLENEYRFIIEIGRLAAARRMPAYERP